MRARPISLLAGVLVAGLLTGCDLPGTAEGSLITHPLAPTAGSRGVAGTPTAAASPSAPSPTVPAATMLSTPVASPTVAGVPSLVPLATGTTYLDSGELANGQGEHITQLSASLEVTSVDLAPGSGEFVADWVMVSDQESNATGCNGGKDNWMQLGWAVMDGHNQDPELFEYDTDHCAWLWFPAYSVTAPGTTVGVLVSACQGETWCAWVQSDGAWQQLTSAAFPWEAAPVATVEEESYNPHPAVQPWARVPAHAVTEVALSISGREQFWDGKLAALTHTNVGSPVYCTTWAEPYSRWTVGSC